ncbi:F-box protein CPR1-like [Papaver somniferum]|uniref:F-box protein CPR1-like n=1 Tax=Papaver somniferum TaxID=3469 RepID=UPI000E6FADEA|nr:F-box protein CPR1-like [Papaver somniferum]
MRKVTTKADVFSYGVLLMEFLTAKRPTGPIEENGFPVTLRQLVERALTNGGDGILEVAEQNMNLNMSSKGEEEKLIALLELALSCTSLAPEDRPDMNEVLSTLIKISEVDGSEIVKMVDFPFNSLPVGPFRFIGSCSGVVCLWFANGVETFICFCNPATKECRRILKRQDNFWNDYDINIINAFGYDCKYDDYKLINIVKRPETDRLLDVIVYKLGSNAWECNQTVTYKFPDKRQTGILVNGAFHWFGEAPEKNPSKLIISMNISNEKFDEVQFPKELYDKNHFPMTIGVLEGCLCLVVTVSMSGSEVWMMQEYGVRESWTQVYTIDNESIWSFPDTDYTLRLVHSFGNGQILLKYGYRLVTYDPEHKRGRELQKNSSSMIHDSMNYVESLVSLSFGYLCR